MQTHWHATIINDCGQWQQSDQQSSSIGFRWDMHGEEFDTDLKMQK